MEIRGKKIEPYSDEQIEDIRKRRVAAWTLDGACHDTKCRPCSEVRLLATIEELKENCAEKR